jgi:hypothetical protein
MRIRYELRLNCRAFLKGHFLPSTAHAGHCAGLDSAMIYLSSTVS